MCAFQFRIIRHSDHLQSQKMDPYAAQWAQYGYAISTPDPSAAAAYNYAYQNYAGVQQTNNTAVAQQTGGAAKNQRPQR